MATKLYEWACEKYGKGNVDRKLTEFLDSINTDNANTLKIQMITDSTVKRLEQLRLRNENIEYIHVASPLIENGIRRLILSYDFVINGILILSDFEAPLHIGIHIQNDNNALGSLINELERFSTNKKLLQPIRNFNSYKKTAGHKMFEEETDIEKVNQELRTYVDSHPMVEIHNEMVKEHGTLQLRLVERLKEYGLISTGTPDLVSAKKKLDEMSKKKVHSAGVESAKEPNKP